MRITSPAGHVGADGRGALGRAIGAATRRMAGEADERNERWLSPGQVSRMLDTTDHQLMRSALGRLIPWDRRLGRAYRHSIKPAMIVRADDLVGMMQEVAEHVSALNSLLEMAWVIIANASGGDWPVQSLEWQQAAERWRDNWHAVSGADRPEQREFYSGGGRGDDNQG